MSLFDNSLTNTSALSQLSQMMASLPKDGLRAQNQDAAPTQTAQPQFQGNGGNGGINIPGVVKAASNLQSLPWLSPSQNMGSWGSALAQGGGASAGMSSAISQLASMFASMFI